MAAQPAPQPFSERSCGHSVPLGSKACAYCRPPRLSVAPLAEVIRRRTTVLGSLQQVSIEVATRLGMRFESVNRQLYRILEGKMTKLDFYTAESYAIALGREMPALIWGDEWDAANPVEPYGDEDY